MKDKFLQLRDYFQANKRRSIIILLVLILLPVGVFLALQQTIFNPLAARPKVGMSLSTADGDKKAFGKPFPVNVSLYNTGATIAGAGVKLEYDPTTVEPVNAPTKEGCFNKGAVQVCQAKNQDDQPFSPFPFMPKDPVVDANAGTIAFSVLSYDEATKQVSDAFQFSEFRNFATVYFKSKLPGNTDIRIVNNGPDDTTSDSNIAAVGSPDDYLVNVAFNTNVKPSLALNIDPPTPFGVYGVKEVGAVGAIAFTRTLEVAGWAVSQSSTVDRYAIYLNGNPVVELQKNDPRVIKVAHPEAGVCGNPEAQANFPDCANGANVGFKINVTKDELESGGISFSDPNIETRPQKLEVKVYSKITQGDEFEGALPYGSLQGPKQLSFFLDDPANKGNPATYAVTKNGNNFVVNIKPQRAAGTYPYVGLVINGDLERPKRLEGVSNNPVEFKWDSTNSYDGQTYEAGKLITVRLYALCAYNMDSPIEGGVPRSCKDAGIAFEPHSFMLDGSSSGGGSAGASAPFGHFDKADGPSCTVSGWAADNDGGNGTIRIDVYRDKPFDQGGQFVANFIANKPKGPTEAIPDNVRFEQSLPLRDNTKHALYLYAIDPQTGNNNPLLNGSPRDITCPAS